MFFYALNCFWNAKTSWSSPHPLLYRLTILLSTIQGSILIDTRLKYGQHCALFLTSPAISRHFGEIKMFFPTSRNFEYAISDQSLFFSLPKLHGWTPQLCFRSFLRKYSLVSLPQDCLGGSDEKTAVRWNDGVAWCTHNISYKITTRFLFCFVVLE